MWLILLIILGIIFPPFGILLMFIYFIGTLEDHNNILAKANDLEYDEYEQGWKSAKENLERINKVRIDLKEQSNNK